jgi:hypothetical protein
LQKFVIFLFRFTEEAFMTVSPPSMSFRRALSPAARAMRLQRIFARMQEGLSYGDIAAEEGISRERLRQIVRAATRRREDAPDHRRMQIARLMPALRLAAYDVENGDAKAIPSLLKLLDRLDRYCDARRSFESPPLAGFSGRSRRADETQAVPHGAADDGAKSA